jgi:hypothetical protein
MKKDSAKLQASSGKKKRRRTLSCGLELKA